MKLNFDEKGLIPAIIQDYKTGKVLTLCYMNKDALDRTLREGRIYVFRRSKNKLMLKGETSGNIQTVKEIFVDLFTVAFSLRNKFRAIPENVYIISVILSI